MKKTNSNILFNSIIVLLALFNIAFLIVNIQSNKRYKNRDEEKRYISSQLRVLYDNTFIQFASENYIVKNIRVKTIYQDSVFLNEFVKEKPKLIFRYSDKNCNSCINNAFKSLLKYSKKIGSQNIIILCSYKNIRTMMSYINSEKVKIKILNTQDVIQLPIEKYNTPYFFILNNNMEATSIFIPIKEIEGYTFI